MCTHVSPKTLSRYRIFPSPPKLPSSPFPFRAPSPAPLSNYRSDIFLRYISFACSRTSYKWNRATLYPFCIRFCSLSLSVMFSRFIHVVMHIGNLFFLITQCSNVGIYHSLFNPSPSEPRLFLLEKMLQTLLYKPLCENMLLILLTESTENTSAQAWKSQVLDHRVGIRFVLQKTARFFAKVGFYQFISPPTMNERSSSFTALSTFGVAGHFTVSGRYVVVPIVVCVSLKRHPFLQVDTAPCPGSQPSEQSTCSLVQTTTCPTVHGSPASGLPIQSAQ